MKRIKEEFLDKLEQIVKLQDRDVLEIGCGSGTRSVQIAKRCKHLIAIEPDKNLIIEAGKVNVAYNIQYMVGSAEKLEFSNCVFDVVMFTLSLHHVPADKMTVAINESIRVTRKGGFVVFLEPTNEGSFFDAEIKFDACDGDERVQKALAYTSLRNNKGYKEIDEISDETVFQFESVEDFITSLTPKKSLAELESFLKENKFILRASRRINIFQII